VIPKEFLLVYDTLPQTCRSVHHAFYINAYCKGIRPNRHALFKNKYKNKHHFTDSRPLTFLYVNKDGYVASRIGFG